MTDGVVKAARGLATVSRRGWALMLAVAVCALAAVIVLPAGAAADGGSTWTGAGSGSGWSDAANWGGTAPDADAGTLSFPALSGNCAQSPPSGTCYSSSNDGQVTSASDLSIDDGSGYDLEGDGLTLGAGGLQASTSSTLGDPSSINLPITLGADQTWAVDGTNGAQLTVGDNVTGDSALSVQFTNSSFLSLNGSDNEAGPVSISGDGSLIVASELNAGDGQTITASDGGDLDAGSGATVGALSVQNGGQIQPGGTLHVNGSADFDDGSNTVYILPGAGSTNPLPELSVSGHVTLAGDITLVSDFISTGGSCPTLTPGATYTLVQAGGGLSGQYAGVPDGTDILTCGTATGQTPGASVRINYTSNAVIGTVINSGANHKAPSATQVTCNDVNPGQAGDYDQCTATVGGSDLNATDLPTGSVNWTSDGTGGSFLYGSTCTLAPGSGNTSFCSVDYGPAAAIETPVPVTATYGGDANFAGSSGTTSLGPGVDTTTDTTTTPTPTTTTPTPTDTSPTTTPSPTTTTPTPTAMVTVNADGQYVLTQAAFGLPAGTVLNTTACYVANPADGGTQAQRRGASITARPAYNSTHPNPVDNGGNGIVSYCAVNLTTNVGQFTGFVVKTAGAAAATVGTVVGGLSAAVGSANPVTGYYIAAGTFPAAAAAGYGTYQIGNTLQTASATTQQDPPDYDYTVVAQPAKVLVPHFNLGAGQAALTARFNALILDERRIASVATAYTTTLNRAGGARLKGATHDEGLQTRAAVADAHTLETELAYAAAHNATVLKAVAKLPSLRTANFTKLAAKLRAALSKTTTARERAALLRIGVPANRVNAVITTLRDTKTAVNPLTVADSANVTQMYARAAKMFEYYTYDPDVVAAAALP